MIDKHQLAARVERQFRLLLAPENATVINGLDDRRPGRQSTVARPRECTSPAPVEHSLPRARL
jgi:hypothetical protein